MNRRRLKDTIFKPEFIYRPSQVLKRLRWKKIWKGKKGTVMLPWGIPLDIDASETVGKAISKIGVYDMMVPEAIFRLCQPGETALDIGANIGFTTGAFALAVGPGGKVLSYEPMPSLLDGLRQTTRRWAKDYQLDNIVLRGQAVSNTSGTAELKVPLDFDNNHGIASLSDSHFGESSEFKTVKVPVTTLDEEFPDLDDRIGVLKIDIEGHELAAFEGAERLLSVGCIRDIIFEEHEPLPTPVSKLLESKGYTIFLLRKDTFGPSLVPTPCRLPKALPNYLATLEPDRANQIFKKQGYLSLKLHSSMKA